MNNGGLVFQDQSASNLRLTIARGEADWKQVHIVKEQVVDCLGGQLHAAIIGSSHVLSFSHPEGTAFHEIFACQRYAPPGNIMADSTKHGFRGLLSYTLLIGGGWSYQFTGMIICEQDTAAPIAALAKRGLGSMTHQLYYSFPRGSLPVAPQTILGYSITDRPSRFTAITLHDYPNEKSVAITATIIRRQRQ
jgi:hypothetical protein